MGVAKAEGRGYQNPCAVAARTAGPSTEQKIFDFCEKSGEAVGWIKAIRKRDKTNARQ
mgnify:CR=1 FL=1|jgi:hypothetical protein